MAFSNYSYQRGHDDAERETASCEELSFLMVIFAFQSHKFSQCFSTSACEALLSDLNSKCDSRITFPGRSEALVRRCRQITSGQTHCLFSHNISCGQLKRPAWRRHFSQVTFRVALENAVFVALAHRKQRKRQPGNVMREKLPVLPLNIFSTEKSLLRMAKNILRNVRN